MEYKYKVSVIVPIYNVEKYLRRAVDSLIAQTLDSIEIILVDDGSPDNCSKIIDEYSAEYSNIVAIHKQNGGLSDARNAGMNVSHGEYIGFVDPDDYVEKDMFEKLYEAVEETDSNLAICGYVEVFLDNSRFDRKPDLSPVGEKSEVAESLILGKLGAYAWNKLFSSNIIKNNGLKFPKGIVVCEDVVFFCEYLKHCKSYCTVDDCLYSYMRNNSSICAKYHERQMEYYRFANEAKKSLIKTFDSEKAFALTKINDEIYLNTCFNVLNQLNAYTNKQSLKSKYFETRKIVNEPFFRCLCEKVGIYSGNDRIARKSRWILNKKTFNYISLRDLASKSDRTGQLLHKRVRWEWKNEHYLSVIIRCKY